MPHSAEFLQKISSPTTCYATQCGMREVATLLYAAWHGVDTYSQISLRNQNRIQKYFRMIDNQWPRES
jgi:hypothetical protein